MSFHSSHIIRIVHDILSLSHRFLSPPLHRPIQIYLWSERASSMARGCLYHHRRYRRFHLHHHQHHRPVTNHHATFTSPCPCVPVGSDTFRRLCPPVKQARSTRNPAPLPTQHSPLPRSHASSAAFPSHPATASTSTSAHTTPTNRLLH
jgi:hypothetical protein